MSKRRAGKREVEKMDTSMSDKFPIWDQLHPDTQRRILNIKFCKECGNPVELVDVGYGTYNAKTGKPESPMATVWCPKCRRDFQQLRLWLSD
jgi:hypothetical protein